MRGDQPCSESGCKSGEGFPCSYVDNRGRVCGTSWCPEHQFSFEGFPYCRRHARLMASLPKDELIADRGRPDVDNRSPSLAVWVGDALDSAMVRLLESIRPPESAQQIESEPLHLVRPTDGSRHWHRAWKLFDHTGTLIKVTVDIDEAKESEITVRVGGKIVAQSVPPWIARRRAGQPPIAEDDDQRERQEFYQYLYLQVQDAITDEAKRQR